MLVQDGIISKVMTMADGTPRCQIDFNEECSLGEFDDVLRKFGTLVFIPEETLSNHPELKRAVDALIGVSSVLGLSQSDEEGN